MFVASTPISGFIHPGGLAAFEKCNEAVLGSLALRLARSPPRGFAVIITAERRSRGYLSNEQLQGQDLHPTSFAKLAWRTRIHKMFQDELETRSCPTGFILKNPVHPVEKFCALI